MRHHPTPAEARLWEALAGQTLGGLKFRFQHPVGQFILDFYCASCKLVVEVDGGIHDTRPEENAARTQVLEAHQCRVIRFRNEEVLTNLETVLSQILTAARADPATVCSDSPRIGGEGVLRVQKLYCGQETSPVPPNCSP